MLGGSGFLAFFSTDVRAIPHLHVSLHVYLPGVKLISSSVNLSPSVSVTGMQGVFSLCLLMLYCTTHSFKCDLGLEMMGV